MNIGWPCFLEEGKTAIYIKLVDNKIEKRGRKKKNSYTFSELGNTNNFP